MLSLRANIFLKATKASERNRKRSLRTDRDSFLKNVLGVEKCSPLCSLTLQQHLAMSIGKHNGRHSL